MESLVQSIRIEDYDYPLPDEQIARFPLERRDSSRLLVYRSGEIGEGVFSDLPDLLPEGCLLVRNDSRVIQARILMHKETGAQIELFCLEPLDPKQYELSLASVGSCDWVCMLGNARRWSVGSRLRRVISTPEGGSFELIAERLEANAVRFSWDGDLSFAQVLELAGVLPIPPYLDRETVESDLRTYQTTYAHASGSVAAPTAGLHFTPELFDRLEGRGIPTLDVTLHVGAGTFRPVKSETIGEHVMHHEQIVLPKSALLRLLEHHEQIIAVGTTSVRTLESLYHLGVSLMHTPETPPESLAVGQWQAYEREEEEEEEVSRADSLKVLVRYMDDRGMSVLSFPTSIIIAPSYRFRMVRGLITNFHQPRSTLLLLISALVGKDWRRIYDYALERGFRFLSYGDSSLLLP